MEKDQNTRAKTTADNLTKRQAEAILAAEQDGTNWIIRWWQAHNMTKQEITGLRKFELGFSVWSGFCLGNFGLAVKDILQEREAINQQQI